MIYKAKKKRCLVVLHCQPLLCEIWKKAFTVQKYTAPNFQNSKKVFFSLNILIFQKYWFKTCIKRVYGKVDLFAPLLGDIEAIILCSFDFDLKKKLKQKTNKQTNTQIRPSPPPPKKSCGGQPNIYFFEGFIKAVTHGNSMTDKILKSCK